jgi:hypothetical protein
MSNCVTWKNTRDFNKIGWGCVAYTTPHYTPTPAVAIPRPPLWQIGFRRWPVLKADFEREKKLIKGAIQDKKASALRTPMAATAARGFLQEYGKSLAVDAAQVRVALTNKLLEIADCGEIKYELKAIELLGKHSDIGLFTERSEININYNSPDALEKQIKERVKRLLNADIIDVTPLGMDLDEELGIAQLEYIEEEDVQEPVQEEDVQEPVQEEDEE